MKNIYLYGASDDCCEIETDFDRGFESYGDIKINSVIAHYEYDDDWAIWLEGDIPTSWKVKSIGGNAAWEVREKPHGGQFIHIQVPEEEPITYTDLSEAKDVS